jgi:hypothetical protein
MWNYAQAAANNVEYTNVFGGGRMKTPISFRLRKDMDIDLIQAVAGLEQKRIVELCRTGLRLALGIKTQRVIEIKEQPINVVKGVTAKIGNRPYVPAKEGRR